MKTKICSKCKKEKDVSEFPKDRNTKDGLSAWCKECHKRYVKRYPYRKWASTTLSGHRRRGYKISITLNELEKIAKKSDYCPICDVKLDWSYFNKGKWQINSPSLDRKNNEEILNESNVWIICFRCNSGKQDKPLDDFVKYCKRIANKFYKKEVTYDD